MAAIIFLIGGCLGGDSGNSKCCLSMEPCYSSTEAAPGGELGVQGFGKIAKRSVESDTEGSLFVPREARLIPECHCMLEVCSLPSPTVLGVTGDVCATLQATGACAKTNSSLFIVVPLYRGNSCREGEKVAGLGRSVVVTGLGAVTAFGMGAPALGSAIAAGRSGLGPLTRVAGWDGRTGVAGEVEFNPPPAISARMAKRLDRHVLFALAASLEACRDAGLGRPLPGGDEAAVVIGSSRGGETSLLEGWGKKRTGPLFLPRILANMAAAQVSIFLGARGPSWGLSAACATGGAAIGEAWEIIRRGDATLAVCGGAETPLTALSLAGFEAMGVLSRRRDPAEACRPFQRGRDGFVPAEGAGVLVLEEAEHARVRGAGARAVLTGYGAASDAHHPTAPDPAGAGAALAMRRALAKANLAPEAIDYICAHGTGTVLGDAAEAAAVANIFGSGKPPVSSLKAALGHTLGAAGAIEAVACVMALERQIIPPTVNCGESEFPLDLVPNRARPAVIRHCLSNSFGFGGHNVSLVFSRA